MPTTAASASTGEQAEKRCALYTDNRFAQGLAGAMGIRCFALQAFDALNLAESGFDQHVILDVTLLHGNPDFIEQRDLGAAWCKRIESMTKGATKVSAELNGLTGCKEVFVPTAAKAPSVLNLLANLFAR